MAQSGQTLMDEANKKLNYKSIFGGNKLDDAQSLFGRAGNAFKLEKLCSLFLITGKEAGNAYYQQGQCLEKMGERDEASSCYLNAGKSLKKEDPKRTFRHKYRGRRCFETGCCHIDRKGPIYRCSYKSETDCRDFRTRFD